VVNFFESLQCRILGSCVSVIFFFFVIVKRDGFALFDHFADRILITQDSAKHEFFILFIFCITIPIFTAKFSAPSSYDGPLCLEKRSTWNTNCISSKTLMIRKVRTVLKKEIKLKEFSSSGSLYIYIYFNCCTSVHVDNHTIITPTKCTPL
jgi:hypothetical protein